MNHLPVIIEINVLPSLGPRPCCRTATSPMDAMVAVYKGLERWLIHTPFAERPGGTPATLGAEPMLAPEPDLSSSGDPDDEPL